MNRWPSTKASRVFAALLRIDWSVKRHARGSHRVLAHPNWPDVVFAFHDSDAIGPRMLAGIAKRTGLSPEDL
jgi:predicted RNA binding protein YcfA (HicA-like mRNA interferase family)